MQIDFHHGVTYVTARLAGFEPRESDIIATAAQYVDDAVNSGTIWFKNGAMYARISSAHKMLDYRNFEALADALVWLPFHFLPGNGGLPAGQHPDGAFVQKLICLPNSPVAQDLIRSVIRERHRRYALHRLGVTLHTYADTWAHQGFVGVPHVVNHATNLTGPGGEPDHSLTDRMENYFINKALPLGHGAVLSNPDKPFLTWGYTNGHGDRIERNNPVDFLNAADHMCRVMQCFRAGDAGAATTGLSDRDRAALWDLINELRSDKPEDRHTAWLAEIARGTFSFGREAVRYVGEGDGSWKHHALGAHEPSAEEHNYREEFLASDWKLFHDALQAHRFDVMLHILPEYGICAA
jgi:hypothetical protein